MLLTWFVNRVFWMAITIRSLPSAPECFCSHCERYNPFMVIASAISPIPTSGRSYYALREKYTILITDKIIIRPNFGRWYRKGLGRWRHTGPVKIRSRLQPDVNITTCVKSDGKPSTTTFSGVMVPVDPEPTVINEVTHLLTV
jgi:hypothetical protein